MKKRILAFVLALCMVFALAACGPKTENNDNQNNNSNTTDEKVVKIGIFEPASGDNGAGGKQEALGAQYANTVQPTVEIGGETYKVELVPADNQSSNDKAPSAAQTLISAGVSVVLGSYGSGVSIAASDIFGDAGVPAIGVSCTNPQVTAGNSHYFRICFLDPFQGTVLANFAKENFSATKAYCLAKLGDDYSVGLCNYFMQAFGEENCVYETFPEGTSDYSAYVTNAKNNGCDVFFAPVSTEAAALIIDQAVAQDLGMPILAGDTWDSNVITAAAQGKSNVQIYVTTFYQEGGNAEFDEGFKAYLNSDSTAMANNGGNDMIAATSAMGYDAYFVALEALKAAGSTDPAAVMAALPSVTYEGVSGAIAFDDVNGDAIRDAAYVKVCNTETGTWDFVSVQGID
ncbi:MAG: ABC transporter substrate-binding protein [Oscillospiraceae bacterium]|jgi:branched-chain amino acid transport system substrate-binding protein|nr:ABC transporter substrate-binding protein [Oscillospiraceae bacterium]